MSESPGATRTALVLRLSVPAAGSLRVIASDLAVRLAEHLGAAVPDHGQLSQAVEQLAGRVAPRDAASDVDFEFRRSGTELVIGAHCDGQRAELRYPLPA